MKEDPSNVAQRKLKWDTDCLKKKDEEEKKEGEGKRKRRRKK